MSEQAKERCKAALRALIARYRETQGRASSRRVSEETARAWINDFLGVFGWDVRDVSQVWQEAVLDERDRRRLADINSTHKRPDYTLLAGSKIQTFLDAKSFSVDVFTNRAAAFQARSYGWSAQVPCTFVSNFRQTAIYDTRFMPDVSQGADSGVIQIGIDDYLDKFDVLYGHLWRENVLSGGLGRLYASVPSEGTKTLDVQFMGVLSAFRRKLAEAIWERNAKLVEDDDGLNYYVQVIMDRIVFIRVCESKGIERGERLREFQSSSDGFWRAFRASCYMEFHRHYDGAMFSRDERFSRIELDDAIFSGFLDSLYYPSPYRFDVVPVILLAKIYEEFLGKRLVVRRGKVCEEIKGEYVKTNGAIPTPAHLVRLVCHRTLKPSACAAPPRIPETKILDPCCGSGIFLVACYDALERAFIDFLKAHDDCLYQYRDYYLIDERGNWLLTIPGRRFLIVNCLFGIDIDESAVEVAKMSLSLKVLDGNCVTVWDAMGADGERILRDIAENVKLGNALVPGTAALTRRQKDALRAFEPERAFPSVFKGDDPGFAYVVCNPPYVETKFFKEAQPALHRYLSQTYTAFEGKADLAVLFIERCLALLSKAGRAGFIVQRRWFKTEYGRGIRRIINDGKNLESVLDFAATDLFPRRITYVAVLTLSKSSHPTVSYLKVAGDAAEVASLLNRETSAGLFALGTEKPVPHPENDGAWDFAESGISFLSRELLSRHGRLDALKDLQIKDGIQALWKKAYHFRDVAFSGKVATGTNGFGERVSIEADILRGVVYNREFYPFKRIVPDAWCLFPYRGASSEAIAYSEIKRDYPLAYEYLRTHERQIRQAVACRGGDLWHTFTREHNHGLYHADKIIVPMTARDTIASFAEGDEGLYMDNANVWFLTVPDASRALLKAVAAVLNSTAFSVLAKATANPQSGGYYKFNKQFLAPVPFPSDALLGNAAAQRRLAALHDAIRADEESWIASRANRRETLSQRLSSAWEKLDAEVERLYGLSAEQVKEIRVIGRTVDRLSLLPTE